MKKIVFFLLIIIVSVGVYKFKFSPSQMGEKLQNAKVTKVFRYIDKSKKEIKVTMYGTDIVEVDFIENKNKSLNSFRGYIVISASGSKYLSKDNQYIFWSKGDEATIFNKDDKVVFSGELIK